MRNAEYFGVMAVILIGTLTLLPEKKEETSKVIQEPSKTQQKHEPSVSKPTFLEGEGLKLCENAGIILRAKDDRGLSLSEYLTDHRLFSNDEINIIKNGSLRIGGNECLIYASWGVPRDINTTVNSHGESKQFVFGYGKPSYVYTENGIITSVSF